jgi:uncharacterized MAPEG superfamily protein
MVSLTHDPAFVAYAVCMLVLSANLIFLWVYSGAVRGGTKTTPNPEDARTIARGVTVAEIDPPAVARVLRAHKNAMANIFPFAALGLVFVLAGGSALAAEVIFGVFAFARLAHSFAYLAGKQPWRSIFFGLGGLATLALMVFIIRALVVA